MWETLILAKNPGKGAGDAYFGAQYPALGNGFFTIEQEVGHGHGQLAAWAQCGVNSMNFLKKGVEVNMACEELCEYAGGLTWEASKGF